MLFGLPARARLLFTLGLAQAGEFGFFLLGFATASRVLTPDAAATLLLVIALSMMLTPALFWLHGADRGADAATGRGAKPTRSTSAGHGDHRRHGPVRADGEPPASPASATAPSCSTSHLETVERMRALGIAAFYGDVDRPELLEAAGIAEAKAVVLAIDDAAASAAGWRATSASAIRR